MSGKSSKKPACQADACADFGRRANATMGRSPFKGETAPARQGGRADETQPPAARASTDLKYNETTSAVAEASAPRLRAIVCRWFEFFAVRRRQVFALPGLERRRPSSRR